MWSEMAAAMPMASLFQRAENHWERENPLQGGTAPFGLIRPHTPILRDADHRKAAIRAGYPEMERMDNEVPDGIMLTEMTVRRNGKLRQQLGGSFESGFAAAQTEANAWRAIPPNYFRGQMRRESGQCAERPVRWHSRGGWSFSPRSPSARRSSCCILRLAGRPNCKRSALGCLWILRQSNETWLTTR